MTNETQQGRKRERARKARATTRKKTAAKKTAAKKTAAKKTAAKKTIPAAKKKKYDQARQAQAVQDMARKDMRDLQEKRNKLREQDDAILSEIREISEASGVKPPRSNSGDGSGASRNVNSSIAETAEKLLRKNRKGLTSAVLIEKLIEGGWDDTPSLGVMVSQTMNGSPKFIKEGGRRGTWKIAG